MKTKLIVLFLLIVFSNHQTSFALGEHKPLCKATIGELILVNLHGATLAAALLQFADDGEKCWITEKTEAHDGYRMPEKIYASQIVYAKGEHLPYEKLQLLRYQLGFLIASNSPRK